MSDPNTPSSASSLAIASSPTSQPKTRRSTRDIKRKRFDDEIVGNGARSGSVSKRTRLSSTESASSTTSSSATFAQPAASPVASLPAAVPGSKPVADQNLIQTKGSSNQDDKVGALGDFGTTAKIGKENSAVDPKPSSTTVDDAIPTADSDKSGLASTQTPELSEIASMTAMADPTTLGSSVIGCPVPAVDDVGFSPELIGTTAPGSTMDSTMVSQPARLDNNHFRSSPHVPVPPQCTPNPPYLYPPQPQSDHSMHQSGPIANTINDNNCSQQINLNSFAPDGGSAVQQTIISSGSTFNNNNSNHNNDNSSTNFPDSWASNQFADCQLMGNVGGNNYIGVNGGPPMNFSSLTGGNRDLSDHNNMIDPKGLMPAQPALQHNPTVYGTINDQQVPSGAPTNYQYTNPSNNNIMIGTGGSSGLIGTNSQIPVLPLNPPMGPTIGPGSGDGRFMQHPPPHGQMPPLMPGYLPPLPEVPIVNPTNTAYAVVTGEKKEFGDRSKRKGKTRKAPNLLSADLQAKNSLGRWQAIDDLALITAVLQTNDLSAVQRGVKFSCKFTLEEVSQRWYCLLYDKSISKNATDAMKSINPEIVVAVQSKTLYSSAEEDLLRQLPAMSNPPPNLATFERLLIDHSNVFHPARSPQSLLQHWQLMSQYSLLVDQKVIPLQKREADYKLSLSDLEDSLLGHDSTNPASQSAGPGSDPRAQQMGTTIDLMAALDRKQSARIARNEMRMLENEIPRFQTLVESVTGISPPDFDSQTLAVLRGRVVRYLMRSREISFGRSSKAHPVDIDLSLEGPSWKVSRKQGTIKMKPTGDFILCNDGTRPVFIDGRPVLTGCSGRLNHNSVVEISCLRLIFLIHQDLVSTLRSEAVKLMIVN